jgi:hypothetical protein
MFEEVADMPNLADDKRRSETKGHVTKRVAMTMSLACTFRTNPAHQKTGKSVSNQPYTIAG